MFLVSDKLAQSRINAKLHAGTSMPTTQRKAFEVGGQDEAEFMKDIQQMFAELLRERNYYLPSAREQALVRAQLRASFPNLQPWSDEDEGLKHNMGVAKYLRQLGEDDELELLRTLCPRVAMAEDAASTFADGIVPGIAHHNHHDMVPVSRSYSKATIRSHSKGVVVTSV